MLWERDRLPLNEKKSTKSQIRLMSWYWTQKSTWRKDLIAYNSHLRTRIMFPFDYHLEKAGGRFIWNWMSKAKQVEEFRTRASWQGVWGVLKIGPFSWMPYVNCPRAFLPGKFPMSIAKKIKILYDELNTLCRGRKGICPP